MILNNLNSNITKQMQIKEVLNHRNNSSNINSQNKHREGLNNSNLLLKNLKWSLLKNNNNNSNKDSRRIKLKNKKGHLN